MQESMPCQLLALMIQRPFSGFAGIGGEIFNACDAQHVKYVSKPEAPYKITKQKK
jgi:hypothetical protein